MLRLKADPSKLKAKHDNFHITYIFHIDSHLPDLGEMILEKKTRIPIQKVQGFVWWGRNRHKKIWGLGVNPNSNILHANYHHVTPFKSNTIRDFLSNKWQVMKNFLKIQLIHELYQLKWKSHATTINSRNKKKQQISRSRKLQTYKMSSVKYLNILC